MCLAVKSVALIGVEQRMMKRFKWQLVSGFRRSCTTTQGPMHTHTAGAALITPLDMKSIVSCGDKTIARQFVQSAGEQRPMHTASDVLITPLDMKSSVSCGDRTVARQFVQSAGEQRPLHTASAVLITPLDMKSSVFCGDKTVGP